VVDKEDLCMLKINCKGKRTVGKANKGTNVEKIIIGLKIKKEKRKKKEENSRDQHSVGGHPREVIWAVTSKGKDSDSSDSRKTLIILIF